MIMSADRFVSLNLRSKLAVGWDRKEQNSASWASWPIPIQTGGCGDLQAWIMYTVYILSSKNIHFLYIPDLFRRSFGRIFPTPTAGSRWSIYFFSMLPAWIPKVSLDLLDPWPPVDDTCDSWGSWRLQGPCCHYVKQHCLRHLWKPYFFGVHWYLCWVWILPCICVKDLHHIDGKKYDRRTYEI